MIFLRDASEKQWEDEIVAGRELRNGRSCWIFATGRASPPRSIPALRVSQRTRTIVSWCRLYGRKWNETVFLVKIGKGDSREHKSLFFSPLSFVFDDEHTLFIEIVQRWFSVILDVCDTRGGILLRSLGKKERNELVDLFVRCYLMRFCTFFSVFSILSPPFSFRSFFVRSRTTSSPR